MSEMIERCAEAVEALGPVDPANYRDRQAIVRAVVHAMREPTEAMVVAGVHHDNMGDMAGPWKAMIDAALSQAPLHWNRAMSNGSKKRMREALKAIRDYPTNGKRATEDGYPAEVAYDEWAYRRMVDAYREAARNGLSGASS